MKTLMTALIVYMVASAAQSRDITLAMSPSIPPYVIKETQGGIMSDIVKEALAIKGHTVKEFNYVSNKRLVAMIQSGQVDGGINTPPNLMVGFVSEPILHFENVVIAAKARNYQFNHISDLTPYRVQAFQYAKAYLGPEFVAMAEGNSSYHEVILQVNQLRHLFLDRTDAIILDRQIFLYYLNELRGQMTNIPDVAFFTLFPKAPRHAVFLDEDMRDDFNDALLLMKSSGRVQAIMDQYSTYEKD